MKSSSLDGQKKPQSGYKREMHIGLTLWFKGLNFLRSLPVVMKYSNVCWSEVSSSRRSKNKDKGLPQQAEVAQWSSRQVKAPDFLDVQHYKGGRSSAIRTGCLYPRRNFWYSLSEAESTSGHMVLSGVPRKKSPVTPPGIDPGTVRPVAQRLNHYATPGPQ